MADIGVPDERYAKWALEYQEFLESGMSQAEWCSMHDVNLHTFRYRLSRLRKTFGNENELAVKRPEFVKIPAPASLPEYKAVNTSSDSGIVLETGKKKIRIEGNPDIEVLRTVMEVFMNA